MSKYSSIIISRASFRDLEPATRPLLIKDSLSEKETSFLLEVLGKSIRNRKDQDRIEWENAIELAKEYAMGIDPYGDLLKFE